MPSATESTKLKSFDLRVREGKPPHLDIVLVSENLNTSFATLVAWTKAMVKGKIQSSKYTAKLTVELGKDGVHAHTVINMEWSEKEPAE